MTKLFLFRTLFITTTLSLTGCSLAPEYQRPDSVADPVVELKAAQSSGRYRFQDLYRDDPALLAILDKALINNFDLQLAMARVESTRAQKLSSLFDLIPSLNYTASKTISMNSVSSPLNNQTLKQRSEQYQGRMGVDSWEVDLWGRRRNKIAAMNSSEESHRSLVANVQLTLMSDLAKAWYEAHSMIQVWHILQNKKTEMQRIEEKLMRINQQGRLEPIVLTKFLRGQGNDESTTHNLEVEILARIHQLEYLSGTVSPALNAENWQTIVSYNEAPQLMQAIRSDIILNRPDVIAAEWQIKAANGNIGSARAALLPGVSLFANAWRTSSSLDGIVDSYRDNWTLTPSVMIPVFDLPKHYASLKYAETQQKLAIIDYRNTIAQALKEIKDATDALRLSQGNLAVVREELRAQSVNFDKNKRRYEAGYQDLYTYYESLDIYSNAQIELESKRQLVILNSVALLKSLGG